MLPIAFELVLCTEGEVVGEIFEEEEQPPWGRLLTTVGGRVSWIIWPGKYS